MRVLDAGCGRKCRIRPAEAHITGIDVDPEAVAANPDLDERLVGSIETEPLPTASFDLVVCWDVLEHLRAPDRALASLAQSVAPGGELLLAFPNAMSFKGLITRATPHWFHRWVYRRVYRVPLDPFPTVLRRWLTPRGIRRWAAANGLAVKELRVENGPLLGWRSEVRVRLLRP
jgi:2-polyprenyl-3-methyl-5-hydroxy-6-metoxy-1,4-benzoquinol methylase